MTINERIIAALSPGGYPVVPEQFTGTEPIYYTFVYTLLPRQFVDNRPLFYRVLIQVHLFAPHRVDTVQLRAETMQRLSDAKFDWPEIIPASDDKSQHYVFETGTVESTRNLRKE